jgi:predicted deacylase
MRPSLLVVLLSAAALPVAAADFTVGTATASPGQRVAGFIQVPAGSDAAASVPVVVIHGARPGPVLALTSGAHGTEYASVVAVARVTHAIDPRTLSGTIIALPLINVASFLQIVPHLNPIDGKSLNRLYPGKADGTQSERITWAVAKQVIERADYLIDFHGGDLDENMRKYSYWADTGQEKLDVPSRGMVLAFGLDHIIIQHPSNTGSVTASRYAQMVGKPCIVVEAGHAGTVNDEDVGALMRGIFGVTQQLKMTPGSPRPVENPVWIDRAAAVAADRDGMFFPLVVPEAYVEKGMKVGFIQNYFGDHVADVVAPAAGVVIYIRAVPSLRKGDTVVYIGEVVAGPKGK